jgi:membrane associated rhomboid family serine protease
VVLPIRDDNPTRRTPWVTYLLILLNVVVFLQEPISRLAVTSDPPLTQACRQEAYFRRYAAIPKELTSNHPLPDTFGEAVPPDSCARIPVTYDKKPALSVLYAMFLHGGWLHLLGNMLFLFVFGNNVEDRLGRLAYLAFYLACGFLATYVFAFANSGSQQTLVGASGAIAGVLGAYFVLFPRARVLSLVTFLFFIPVRLPAWIVLGSWFVIQYMYSRGTTMAPGSDVAYLAHVAGFIAGVVGMFLVRRRLAPAYSSAYGWRR